MCFLRITSNTSSFREEAALGTLPVYSIREKGEIRRKKTGEVNKQHSVTFDVSAAEWNEFSKQVEDAILFLRNHGKTLSELLETLDIADAALDFPLWSRLSDKLVMQCERLPSELISLAGALGISIEMSVYQGEAFEKLG